MVVKTVRKNGYSTSKPDKLTTLFFDYELTHLDTPIISTFTSKKCLFDRKDEKYSCHPKLAENFYLDKNAHNTRLSEFRWSKLFEDVLLSMKKFEYTEVEIFPFQKFDTPFGENEAENINQPAFGELFAWGKDYERTVKFIEEKYGKSFSEVVKDCNIIYI